MAIFLASPYISSETCHSRLRIPPPIRQRDTLFLDNADGLEYRQYESETIGRRSVLQRHSHMGRERCGEDSSGMPMLLD